MKAVSEYSKDLSGLGFDKGNSFAKDGSSGRGIKLVHCWPALDANPWGSLTIAEITTAS